MLEVLTLHGLGDKSNCCFETIYKSKNLLMTSGRACRTLVWHRFLRNTLLAVSKETVASHRLQLNSSLLQCNFQKPVIGKAYPKKLSTFELHVIVFYWPGPWASLSGDLINIELCKTNMSLRNNTQCQGHFPNIALTSFCIPPQYKKRPKYWSSIIVANHYGTIVISINSDFRVRSWLSTTNFKSVDTFPNSQ